MSGGIVKCAECGWTDVADKGDLVVSTGCDHRIVRLTEETPMELEPPFIEEPDE